MKKINDIIYSIKINYKSWLIFLLIIYFLSNNIFIGILNFMIFFVFSYIAHYISHSNYFEFYTIIHKYHHQKNNWFGFFNEIIDNHDRCFHHFIQVDGLVEYIGILTGEIFETVHYLFDTISAFADTG